jgi:hypothetical protein
MSYITDIETEDDMTITEIRTELLSRIGNVNNEPAGTAIGRFIREQEVSMAELAADLDRTDDCAELAAAVRRMA